MFLLNRIPKIPLCPSQAAVTTPSRRWRWSGGARTARRRRRRRPLAQPRGSRAARGRATAAAAGRGVCRRGGGRARARGRATQRRPAGGVQTGRRWQRSFPSSSRPRADGRQQRRPTGDGVTVSSPSSSRQRRPGGLARTGRRWGGGGGVGP
ncbi:hypothetical protein DAI22_01g315000 [Oryza sativa Japonica Group]|nr:hypothetical protein DAI22_01g315000 [Oryza sativa Japonica Group]